MLVNLSLEEDSVGLLRQHGPSRVEPKLTWRISEGDQKTKHNHDFFKFKANKAKNKLEIFVCSLVSLVNRHLNAS